ncbi:MAG: sulfotransferase, partial [Deltaproteobacteria bacterium]|nr:sulfotransferase [Deltaproteobacteria bacterium]
MKFVEKSNRAPIFIHALFRTGSTYLWRKFRQVEGFYCYYEPLHHFFLEIDRNYRDKFWKGDRLVGKELQIKKHFLHEYDNLIDNQTKGLPYFKKSFIFDQYCKTDTNLELQNYINFLIENAKDRRPVFQFNRTALRTRWFKRNYPEALNIYLVRNPRDQWESCIRKAKKSSNIFVVMDLMISSLNLSQKYFYELAQHLPLVQYQNKDFQDERIFYDTISDAYSTQDKYFIFYYIWLLSLIENILCTDMTININLLKNDIRY